ncbi:hypothetical protein CPC16_002454 [Podila verticillata]|nr:hypothetical protein CPC16_002454 [Podila verticillata]
MFRPTAFLLAISMVFLGLLSAVSAAAIPQETDIVALGQTFQALRQVKGHWDGADFNPAVDAFNGEKHQVMQKLYAVYSKPGVVSAEIVATMGPSDEIPANILAQLRRSAPQVSPPTNFKYIVYKWRGFHDYIWFRVNMKNDMVQASEFYAAYE